jgi:hypothetical protein
MWKTATRPTWKNSRCLDAPPATLAAGREAVIPYGKGLFLGAWALNDRSGAGLADAWRLFVQTHGWVNRDYNLKDLAI